ncbi:hypothetical protein [Brevundimonas sp. R86498]|uniref:hypothetical protein n=1 Tax=Brevundimonas sp. R86498 TaxID=3093845 RepID=UPI0037CA944B
MQNEQSADEECREYAQPASSLELEKEHTMIKLTKLSVAAAISAISALSTGANAQTAAQVDRYHSVARGAVSAVGGGVGSSMCGAPCAAAMRSGTQGAYNMGRAFQDRTGPRLQAFGRDHVRPQVQRILPRSRSSRSPNR